jgi:hypothetical protein
MELDRKLQKLRETQTIKLSACGKPGPERDMDRFDGHDGGHQGRNGRIVQ